MEIKRAEVGSEKEAADHGNMLFLTRLCSVVNKILKVGAKNTSILNNIYESKLVGAIFKSSEMYVQSRYNKHLLIQIVQLQKSVLVSKMINFQHELLESPVIFQIFNLNRKRSNLLYSQILEFFKLMEEFSGKDSSFPEKYITYFMEHLEKAKEERLIGMLLKTQHQLFDGRRSLGDFFPRKGSLPYTDSLLDQGQDQLDELGMGDTEKNND